MNMNIYEIIKQKLSNNLEYKYVKKIFTFNIIFNKMRYLTKIYCNQILFSNMDILQLFEDYFYQVKYHLASLNQLFEQYF